jgi:hypothetical protein
VIVVVLALGCTSGPVLYVDLHTDFNPGEEVDLVYVTISSDRAARPAELYVSLPPEETTLAGFRLSDVRGVPPGTLSVHGELYRRGVFVTSTSLRVYDFESQSTAPLLMTRGCAGVVCPLDGDPRDATTCVGDGVCISPDCLGLPTDPPGCPDPECDDDGDCPDENECGTGVCLRGVCGVALAGDCRGGRCVTGGVCVGEPLDAGMNDDAGTDCAPEICNGVDDDCDGRTDEVDADDPDNCGFCGNVCADGPRGAPVCIDGECALACDAGFGDCNGLVSDGCEQDLRTLVTGGCADSCTIPHCGACGVACALANAWETCVTDTCEILSCRVPYRDCDGDPSNGCEVYARTLTDCGTCGRECAPMNVVDPTCITSSCSYRACADGFADCDGDRTNGCERSTRTLTDCGGCGVACGADATASCASGMCVISSCDGGYQNCDGDALNGCEIGPSTAFECAACGIMCDAPNVATFGCVGMGVTCLIAACQSGWCDNDSSQANGCETPC